MLRLLRKTRGSLLSVQSDRSSQTGPSAAWHGDWWALFSRHVKLTPMPALLPNRASNKALCSPCVFKGTVHFGHVNSKNSKFSCRKYPPAYYLPSTQAAPGRQASMPVPTSNCFSWPLPTGVCLLLDTCARTHPHGDFFVIQHHVVCDEFAVETWFLYRRLCTAPETLSVKIKDLYIILIKPKIKILILILMKVYNPYCHSGNGNTNTYSKPEANPSDILSI